MTLHSLSHKKNKTKQKQNKKKKRKEKKSWLLGLACRLAVASARRTMTIIDMRRVIDVVADHCMMEDRVDRCSS